ncbi:ArsB/NhaD family transporter [Calditerrivibrio nitroreducens]|uniref:Possible tyrosine transporter P-protein n=1 Tax=Calditerrivibrio nitroreducens (strain DSM 19672 / NBRC 101217 / Yu37-1) TaxID=768670 RepID=E4TF95_CALNY|nr:ArsB/NhaD family transporter [Calditerrivibrio nitroreducens]ADR18434.1 possible tyrosine transporter P-protein [Calditerrivibrio nitroreducens DSM 19672]
MEIQTDVVINSKFWAATAILIFTYILIISEKVNKTIVSIFGASLMIMLHLVDQKEAFYVEELGVDWNVIFLLISMMIIINIMKPTGFFEYIAIKSAKFGKGDPIKIMLTFAMVTAVLSAFLDNVTTVLLIAPVSLLIADALEISPIPFLIVEALASNIGGTATLIGDPPNIMIGSKAKLGFVDFLLHLTPVVLIAMFVFLLIVKLIFKTKLKISDDKKQRILSMDESKAIKDPVLLSKSLFVLGLVLSGFVLHGILHYEPATIALFGAGLLLLLAGIHDPHHIFSEIEWSTIFFFIGLFIIIGGVVKVGLIKLISVKILEITNGNLMATSMLIIWFSAFASAFIDNIPYVATMNPLIINMAAQLWPDEKGLALLHHPELLPLWWSLALGACLGGNGTMIGASANVIVVGIANKAGEKITFLRFLKYGMPTMVLTVIVSSVYIYIRYYLLK